MLVDYLQNKSKDKKFMSLALNLAKKGLGRVFPNPAVGAVLVKDNRIIGRGYHKEAGLPHAEIVALEEAGGDVYGSTLYVNLEPCAHWGKTPPCCERIIKEGIKRVVVAMKDPNPLVCGKGLKQLEEAGIEVELGLLNEKAERLNEAYIKHVSTGLPFVILKVAMTLDGKITIPKERWITTEESRRLVHRLRSRVDGVLVGKGTVLADNPYLTARVKSGRNPIKIIVDSSCQIPLTSNVLRGRVIIATTKHANKERQEELKSIGAQILVLPFSKNGVDLKLLMKELGKKGVTSLLIEGGAKIYASSIEEGIVDKILFFISPRIVGGHSLASFSSLALQKTVLLKEITTRKIGRDILITGYVEK